MKDRKNVARRILTVLLLVTILTTGSLLSGCSRRGMCYECGQNEKLNKYVKQGMCGNLGDEGEVVYVCDDCLRLYKMFGE